MAVGCSDNKLSSMTEHGLNVLSQVDTRDSAPRSRSPHRGQAEEPLEVRRKMNFDVGEKREREPGPSGDTPESKFLHTDVVYDALLQSLVSGDNDEYPFHDPDEITDEMRQQGRSLELHRMQEFDVYDDVVPWNEPFETEGAKVIYVKWHEVRKEDCCCSVWWQKISQEQNQMSSTRQLHPHSQNS